MTFSILILGIAVIVPMIYPQDAQQSEREAMYYRYLDFAPTFANMI